uniref:Uncharacterized protein n=1 Tax=Hyaloperonospora arabidopsidis (strain Emoy2) TaxID=559515 RepID=M4C2V4_HYAAE
MTLGPSSIPLEGSALQRPIRRDPASRPHGTGCMTSRSDHARPAHPALYDYLRSRYGSKLWTSPFDIGNPVYRTESSCKTLYNSCHKRKSMMLLMSVLT